MRVPDEMLKCVGFVAEGDDSLDVCGTGFFVSVPLVEARRCTFFVTAKHVATTLRNRESCILVNQKDGGILALPLNGNGWWFHENDTTADVAVAMCELEQGLDLLTVPLEMFLKREAMPSRKIGIGDEVYITGLFTFAAGEKRNMPIVRHGNIAMIPDEQIQTEDGFADVYLIEARSIGGLSGSPVFVRETVGVPGQKESGESQMLHGIGNTYLLGLVRGHWDIKESDLNKPIPMADPRHGVNLGIAIVVPADKIIEIINRPELRALREEYKAKILRSRMPTPHTGNN